MEWVLLPQEDEATAQQPHPTESCQRTGHSEWLAFAINCPQTAATSDHEAPSSRQLTPRALIPLSRPKTQAPEEELSSVPRRPPTESPSAPHAPPSTSHFESESESRANTAQNGQQSPLLDRLRYCSPPIPCTFIGGPKKLMMISRRRRPFLAAGHRDAALLQPQIAVGVPRLRRRRRELRVLAAGRGRAADQDAAGTEASYSGEAGAEGGAGGECRGCVNGVRY